MGLDIYFKVHNNSVKESDFDLTHFHKFNFLLSFFEEQGLNVETQEDLVVTKEMIKDLITICEKVLDIYNKPICINTLLKLFTDNVENIYHISHDDLNNIINLSIELQDNPQEFRIKFIDILNKNKINTDFISEEFTVELLNSIQETCTSALFNQVGQPAAFLLPTYNGFFFGSTEYDDYYFNNVRNFLNECKEKILPAFDSLSEDETIIFRIWW